VIDERVTCGPVTYEQEICEQEICEPEICEPEISLRENGE
jgi:hypothetical protein